MLRVRRAYASAADSNLRLSVLFPLAEFPCASTSILLMLARKVVENAVGGVRRLTQILRHGPWILTRLSRGCSQNSAPRRRMMNLRHTTDYHTRGMSEALDRLLGVASAALSESIPHLSGECSLLAGRLAPELLELLLMRNGFAAYGGALQVFPAGDSAKNIALEHWNSESLWRSEYGSLAHGCLFFAQDTLGAQFCVYDDAVYRFDPESAQKDYLADSIDAWAEAVCAEPAYQTAFPLLNEWNKTNGELPLESRLVPKIPFILGGEYAVENLHAVEAAAAMRFYGNVAKQIHDLPDGASVELRVID